MQWTVSNSGNGPTTVPHWRDIVYLSLTSGISGATQLAALNVSYLARRKLYRDRDDPDSQGFHRLLPLGSKDRC